MVAVGDHPAGAPVPSARRDRPVDLARGRDGEAPDSLRERVLALGLDNHVNVVALDTQVHDA
jgi:hypothetical protein